MKNTMLLLLMPLLFCAPARAADGLDIPRSVDLALKNNLYVKLAAASSDAQRAETLAAAARLLPQVEFSVSQGRTFAENLAAVGFGGFLGGASPVIGPFNTFDARLRLVASVLDFSSRFSTR